jgi:YidC/Oxa1 family membrane protein insertase
MSAQNNNPGFTDPKTITAIGLLFVFMIGWQYYIQTKYPKTVKPADATTQAAAPTTESKATGILTETTPPTLVAAAAAKPSAQATAPESVFQFQSNLMHAEISSLGMGLKKVELKRYKTRDNTPFVFESKDNTFGSLFSTSLGGAKGIPFVVTEDGPGIFSGVYQEDGLEIRKLVKFIPDNYNVDVQVSVRSSKPDVRLIRTNLSDELLEAPSASFFSPPTHSQDMFISAAGSHDHHAFHKGVKAAELTDLQHSAVGAFGFDSLYFLKALADNSTNAPRLVTELSSDETHLLSGAEYAIPASGVLEIKYTQYVGPKQSEALAKADSRLKHALNFGWFAWIGHPLLSVMQWFYSMSGNYGMAIILLTLMVRLIVLPTNIVSYRSMRKMAEIQPLMKGLKERYKDDPAAMNRETIALYKTYKVNPVSGCLPIFLQIPIFLALYRVFQNSIELYREPFAFWITDLSLKDPFYIFPVLLTGAMYLQQKLTPSTLEPAQQKMMMFMPVFFGFLMLSLPSALTLYMLVSTVFGITQQWFMTRESRANVTKTVEA